jgi:hypothetical protein
MKLNGFSMIAFSALVVESANNYHCISPVVCHFLSRRDRKFSTQVSGLHVAA